MEPMDGNVFVLALDFGLSMCAQCGSESLMTPALNVTFRFIFHLKDSPWFP